jgi:NAD(P)H dehydrogenase (quinone)
MLLVTGANGNLAGRTIANLRKLIPMSQVAVTTHNPESPFARELAAEGVSVRTANFNEPATLVPAFEGVDKVFLIPTQDYDHVRIQQNRHVVDAAKAAGVRHMLYASFISATPNPIADRSRNVHYPTERMILESGMKYTMLRDAWYAEALAPRLDKILESGVLLWLAAEKRANYIARDDLGASAAHALVDFGHEDKIYSLTMTKSLSGAEAAAILSRVFERPIRHEIVTEDTWVDYVKAYWQDFYGDPEILAPKIIGQLRAATAGEFDVATDDYKKITGRDPQTMEEFLGSVKASGKMKY